jgi:hypothetical protein
MHVHVAARDVEVAADQELAAAGTELPGPVDGSPEKADLRRIVLPAVGDIHRRDDQVAQVGGDHPRLEVEGRMAVDWIGAK